MTTRRLEACIYGLALCIFTLIMTCMLVYSNKHSNQYMTKNNGYIYKCIAIEKVGK